MGQKQDYTAANVGFRCAKSAPEVDAEIAAKKAKVTPVPRETMREPKLHRRPKPKDEL